MTTTRSNRQQARDQMLASEAKLAEGVRLLHENFIQGKKLTYDAQGIASIVITPEQIKAVTGKIKIIEDQIRLIENGISPLEEKLKVLEEEIKQGPSEEKNAQRTAIEREIEQKRITIEKETQPLKKEINALKAQFPIPIDQFPDGLKNGIVLFVYKEGFTQIPPMNYMMQREIESFYKASEILFGLTDQDLTGTEDITKKKLISRFNQELSKIILIDARNAALEKFKIPLTNQKPPDFNEIKDSKLRGKVCEEYTKILNEKSKNLLEQYTARTLTRLYRAYHKKATEPKLSFEDFGKELAHYAENYRSAESMLTFNEATHKFSYDSGASVTAHDRKLSASGCANLSMVYEGDYAESSFQVTSSIVKHASLPPISSIWSWSLADLQSHSKKTDVLVETYNNAKDVVEMMVRMRLHGGASIDEVMTIDWNYLLLTTNAGNSEKQAPTYEYIIKAMQLLNKAHFEIEVDGKKVKVNVNSTVFNAGINSLANWNRGLGTTQRVENRNAYIQTTDALTKISEMLPPFKAEDQKDNVALTQYYKQLGELKKVVPPEVSSDLKKQYDDAQRKLNALFPLSDVKNIFTKEQLEDLNPNKKNEKTIEIGFHTIIERYKELKNNIALLEREIIKDKKRGRNVDNLIDALKIEKNQLKEAQKIIDIHSNRLKEINKDIRVITYKIERERAQHWKENKDNIKKSIEALKSPEIIALLTKELDSPDERIRLAATDRILAIRALVYKAYMDDLYYSGEYRKPKNAAIFNSYYAAYQRLNGIETSTGCKSANDRTYVARLFLAAMESGGLREPLIPTIYHETLAFSSITLMSFDKYLDVTEDDLQKARVKQTPILIRAGNIFYIYGDQKGDGNWTFTKLDADPKTTAYLNALPFEQGNIDPTHKKFNTFLINILEKGHQHPYDQLVHKMSDNAMSNSAMVSCMTDTNGAPPKVNTEKFEYLKGIKNIDSIGQLGKYASHKIKSAISALGDVYVALVEKAKKNKNSSTTLISQAGISLEASHVTPPKKSSEVSPATSSPSSSPTPSIITENDKATASQDRKQSIS